jgi:DNA-binding NarL/FixJ family response regulator
MGQLLNTSNAVRAGSSKSVDSSGRGSDLGYAQTGDFETTQIPIRIMIVENQHLVADALEALLSGQPGMVVVSNVDSVSDSPPWVAELHPDVAILGYRVTDEVAAVAARAICQASSEAKVIFLATDASDKATLAAIDSGASALLYMSMAAADLISAVRTVAGGTSLISPQTIARMLGGRRKTDGLRENLTGREREILILISEGASNRAIATVLGISYTTVRTHMRNVAGKLAAHSRLEVLVRAQQLELVSKQPTPTSWGDLELATAGASPN